jgi:TIR domain-containing protein
MGHVFVSYSRRDQARVDLIVEVLTEAGIEVWIDRSDIEAGQT